MIGRVRLGPKDMLIVSVAFAGWLSSAVADPLAEGTWPETAAPAASTIEKRLDAQGKAADPSGLSAPHGDAAATEEAEIDASEPLPPSRTLSLPSGDFLHKAFAALPAAPEPPRQADPDTVEPGEILIATATVEEARRLRAQLQAQGFSLKRRYVLNQLEMTLSVFQAPEDKRAVDVIRAWRKAQPELPADVNHRYQPLSGGLYAPKLIGWSVRRCSVSPVLGLLDGPVNTRHPALQGRNIVVESVLRPNETPAGGRHATAIASLLMGRVGKGGHALLPGARLVNVAIFRQRDGHVDATAEKLLAAVDAAMERGSRIIMFSLGGPANRMLRLAVQRAASRGVSLVAAAGNGGPKGRPVYPAAYASVIGVTAVDARKRLYRRATLGRHVELAAPGVQLKAAWGEQGVRYVSGTSYAVPFAAAALAVERAQGSSAAAARRHLRQQAVDLGPAGRDDRFGYGLLDVNGC